MRTFSGWSRAVAVVVVCGLARAAAAGPTIECAAPKFDFGTRQIGDEIPVSFTLTNTGDERLTITSLSASWSGGGGKPPAVSTNTLAPGAQATVNTTLVLAGQFGPMTRSITVASNDKATPRLKLEIAGTMAPSIAIEPKALDFGSVSVRDAKPQIVTLTAPGADKKFNVRAVTFPRADIFDLTYAPQPDGLSCKITVTPRQDALPQDLKGQLSIRTDSRVVGTVPVEVTGVLTGELNVSPLRVAVTRRPDGSGEAGDIRITAAATGAAFKITGVKTPAAAITSNVSAGPSGYTVTLGSIPRSADMTGKYLLVDTDVPTMKQLRIPFTDVNGGNAGADWGPVVEGVQTHLEFRAYTPGKPLNGSLMVRNVGSKVTTVYTGGDLIAPKFHGTDSKGQPVELTEAGNAALPGRGSGTLVQPGAQRSFQVTANRYLNFADEGEYSLEAEISVATQSGRGSAVVKSNAVTVRAGPATMPALPTRPGGQTTRPAVPDELP
jgi:hypothetical protein